MGKRQLQGVFPEKRHLEREHSHVLIAACCPHPVLLHRAEKLKGVFLVRLKIVW